MFTEALLGLAAVLAARGAAAAKNFPMPGCHNFTPAGTDFADANFTLVDGAEPSDCCTACRAYNAQRSPADPNCTVAVWYRTISKCGFKATATRPIKGHLVLAVQPLPAPPPPPPPKPFRFASIYSDHMVLQSAPARSAIWGFCEPGATVDVTITGTGAPTPALPATVVTDPTTNVTTWSVKLAAIPASMVPTTIEAATQDGDSIRLDDVLWGDVWVCSGQSNMAYSLNGSNGGGIVHPPVNNSVAEIAAMKNYPHIRLFRAGMQASTTDELELAPPSSGGSMDPVLGWSKPCAAGNGTTECRVDFSNMCWFYGRDVFAALEATGSPRPIGLIGTYWGGTADELWSSTEALAKCPTATASTLRKGKPPAKSNSELWHGMVVPLLKTTIKGAIWYQGEADAAHPEVEAGLRGYNCSFPAMIADWREQWHAGTDGETDAAFPFGFVQLNSIGNATVYDGPSDSHDPLSPGSGYAGLRWSQSASHGYAPNPAMPSTFMATSLDTPDRPFPTPIGAHNVDPGFNVHSPFKQPTAARLARAGLSLVYGVDVGIVTPAFKSVSRGPGGVLVIQVGGMGSSSGVEIRASLGFEVSISGVWKNAAVASHTASTITLSNVPAAATALRYLWYSNPCGKYCFGCAVYAQAPPLPGKRSGEMDFLPLPPFIVDL